MNYFDLYDNDILPASQRDQQLHEDSLECTADALSRPLATALRDVLGDAIDFTHLTKPLAYLAIYQVAPGRAEAPGTQAALDTFFSFKDLAGIRPGDSTHALMVKLLQAASPEQLARDLLEGLCGEAVLESPTLVRAKNNPTKVGVCFGISFVERLLLQMRLPVRLRFIRGSEIANPEINGSLRLRLIDSLSSRFPEDRTIKAVLIYLVLVMPIFMLEGFALYFRGASVVAAELRGLVIGTEFQRKPQVAVLIALMKSAGKPVVGIQHGGGYGQTDPNWWERAERWFCDSYRTWGYRHSAKDSPLPSIKLSRQALKVKGAAEAKSYAGLDLRILLAIPYVSEELECSLYSPPYRSQVAAIENSLTILAPMLERDCELTIRLHPKNKGASFIERLSVSGHPKVRFSTGARGSITEDAGSYTALFFSSPQATGIAECLAAGCNFYVAASPDFFWIREEAADQYREMIQCGLWLTGFEQVEALLQSGFAPMTHRQRVFRRAFGKTFARHSDTYIADWIEMLKNV